MVALTMPSLQIMMIFYGVMLLVCIELIYVISTHADWSRLTKLLSIILILVLLLTPVGMYYQRTYAPAFYSGDTSVLETITPTLSVDVSQTGNQTDGGAEESTVSASKLSPSPTPWDVSSTDSSSRSASVTPTISSVLQSVTPTKRMVVVVPKMPEAGVVEITIFAVLASLVVLGVGLVL